MFAHYPIQSIYRKPGMGVILVNDAKTTFYEAGVSLEDKYPFGDCRMWAITGDRFFITGNPPFKKAILKDGGLRVGTKWLPTDEGLLWPEHDVTKLPDDATGTPLEEFDKFDAAREKLKAEVLARDRELEKPDSIPPGYEAYYKRRF